MLSLSAEVVQKLSSSLQDVFDHCLAWQLQAEEYKKNYQLSYQDMFPSSSISNSQTSILYQFQNFQGNNLSFTLRPTPGDGDCFFHAINKPGFNRSTLITKLLENASDKAVLSIFTHEIRQFLYLGYTGSHSNKQENEACQQLLTEDIKGLFLTLKEAEETLTLKVIEVRSELGEAETHGKLPEELLTLLRQRNSNLVVGFEQIYQSLLNADKAIYQHCCQESIFNSYVGLYLRDARGYIPFSRDFGAEVPKTTIDVINQLFQLKIQVYLSHKTNKTQFQLANQPQSGETVPIFHNGINHFWGLIVKSPINTNSSDAHEQGIKAASQFSKIDSSLRLKEEVEHIVRQTSFEIGRDHAEESSLKNRGVSTMLVALSKPLPGIPFDREELQEIIDELPMATNIKVQVKNYIDNIEKYVSEIHRYQSKRKPENLYGGMKTAILGIRNITNEMYELIKFSHPSLPNTIKQLILKWITPLEKELKEHEIPEEERAELKLKTKHLYAEQSFVARIPSVQKELIEHLGVLKKLLAESGEPNPRCYISYAWPSKENKEKEYWVQPYLSVLYDHLMAAGIRVIMDIRDNKPGDNIYQFMKQYHEGNYVILIGTESLLQKHYNDTPHAVQTELAIILNRFEQDQKQFGQSRIYPMLISGSMKSAYPERYQLYSTVRDAREQGYIGTLKKLIDWVYDSRVKKIESQYLSLWKTFLQNYQGLDRDLKTIEHEIELGYHRQRLDYLRQDIQYQNVQAQEKTEHSATVEAKIIGALMESQGTNPKTLFDGHGIQFQRPYTNPDFIERRDLQEKIKKHFSEIDQQILTLTAHGLGGVGKTELAQHFYLHPPRPYTLRAWFRAGSKEQLYIQYIELASTNGIKFLDEMQLEEKAKRVKLWLETQKDCLLVYDNVPDMSTIEGLLPEQGKHHILMTSRNEVDWPAHQKLDVDVMEEEEAIALIRKITGIQGNKEALKKLVLTVGYLPLALAQAGAYMAVKKIDIEQYLILYHRKQASVLSEKTRRHPKHEAVWVTFDMNFEALANECQPALLTLKQASWLNANAIPEVLLRVMIEGLSQDSLWLNIKENISIYSLMRIDTEQHQLSIHPLLQDIVRTKQKVQEQKQVFSDVCKAVNESLYTYGEQDILGHQTLLPHAERLNQHGQTFKQSFPGSIANDDTILLTVEPVQLGGAYIHMGLTKQALDFNEKLLATYEQYYGKNEPPIATPLINLALVCGNSKKKKELLERALLIQRHHYGEEHSEVGLVLSNLGNAYGELGDIKTKKEFLEKALIVQTKCYGNNHPAIATILFNLGNAAGDLGDRIEQKKMLEKALLILEKKYGSDHPRVATILSSLSITYAELGDVRQQKELVERALKIHEKYYGKFHLEVAKDLLCLATAYGILGDVELQKKLIERALQIKEEYFGKRHIEVASALFNLGNVYGVLGDARKYKELAEQALGIETEHYGQDNVEVAKTLMGLAEALGALGDIKQKIALLKRALNIFQKNYVDDHYKVGDALARLGNAYGVLGNYHEQKKILERALVIQEKHYGNKDHIELTDTLLGIGNAYGQLGDVEKKKTLLERVLKAQEQHYKSDDPNIAVTMVNLGNAYGTLGKGKKEKELLERGLLILEQFYGKNHPMVANVLLNLGNVYLGLERQKGLLKRAREIYLLNSPENSLRLKQIDEHLKVIQEPNFKSETIQRLSSNGMAYHKAQKYEEALSNLEKALAIKQENKLQDKDTATIQFNIGAINLLRQDYQEAFPHLKFAYELRLKFLGPEHQSTKKAQERLKQCTDKLNQASLESKADEVVNSTLYSNASNTAETNQPVIFSSLSSANHNQGLDIAIPNNFSGKLDINKPST